MGTSSMGPASSSTVTGGLRSNQGGGYGGVNCGAPGAVFSGPRLQGPAGLCILPSLGCPLAWGCGISGWRGVVWLHAACLCPLLPSTILVEPGCQAEVTETGGIRISVGAEVPGTVGTQLDPIQLSIFSHRFMSIAGEWLRPGSLLPGSLWDEAPAVSWGGWQGCAQRERQKQDPLVTGRAVWLQHWHGAVGHENKPWARRTPSPSYLQPCDPGSELLAKDGILRAAQGTHLCRVRPAACWEPRGQEPRNQVLAVPGRVGGSRSGTGFLLGAPGGTGEEGGVLYIG